MLSSIAGFVLAITGVIAGILALLSDELKKSKRLKYVLVAVLLAFSVYAMLGSLLAISGTDSSVPKSSVPIAIDSTKDWQSTGITVQKGDTIVVSVVGGKWTVLRMQVSPNDIAQLPEEYSGMQVWANVNPENTGDGGGYTCFEYGVPNCPVPTAKVGTLIGKLNLNGEPFPIGNKKSFIASDNGLLFLRVNDGEKEGLANLSDNGGVLAVEIEVYK